MKEYLSDKECNRIFTDQVGKIEKLFSDMFAGRHPVSLYEPCQYIMQSGGKRLRPFLVMLSAKAVGSDYNSVLNAAAAVEILHNFTLVHDDIMDNADKRRGRETIHKKYDLSTAILVGDNLTAIAYQYLLRDCPDNSKAVIDSFTRGIVEVCEGQSLDKEFEIKPSVTINEYKEMIGKKTAALARVCCSIGARLGGGTEEEITLLENYGENLGMAFQIQDDLLDIFAKEEEFGKSVGIDLAEGKKTYLFLSALARAEGEDLALLKNVIKNKGAASEEIPVIRDMYDRLNVIADAADEINKYTNAAIGAAEAVKNKEAGALLVWLAKKLINRNK